jgi:hypothetical protein
MSFDSANLQHFTHRSFDYILTFAGLSRLSWDLGPTVSDFL